MTRMSTELFAREVMPHVRPLWSEYQDRWSPHPLPLVYIPLTTVLRLLPRQE